MLLFIKFNAIMFSNTGYVSATLNLGDPSPRIPEKGTSVNASPIS